MKNKIKKFIEDYTDELVAYSICVLAGLFVHFHPMSEGLRIFLYLVIVYLSDIPTGIYRELKRKYEWWEEFTRHKIPFKNKVIWFFVALDIKLFKFKSHEAALKKFTKTNPKKIIKDLNSLKIKELYDSLCTIDYQISYKKDNSDNRTYRSVKEMLETWDAEKTKLDKFISNNKVLSWIRCYCWYHLEDHPRDLHCTIKHWFQRAKQGYSNRDCWGLYHHLCIVIIGGCKYIKKYKHGIPMSAFLPTDPVDETGNHTDKAMKMAEKRWDKALDEIIHTFETALLIADSHWMYQHSEEYDNKLANKYRRINKKMREEDPKLWERRDLHVMTKKECQRYEKGWKLFQEHFFSLWD